MPKHLIKFNHNKLSCFLNQTHAFFIKIIQIVIFTLLTTLNFFYKRFANL